MHSIWIQPLFLFACLITVKRIPQQYEHTISCYTYVSWKWLKSFLKEYIHITINCQIGAFFSQIRLPQCFVNEAITPFLYSMQDTTLAPAPNTKQSGPHHLIKEKHSKLFLSISSWHAISTFDPNNQSAPHKINLTKLSQTIPHHSRRQLHYQIQAKQFSLLIKSIHVQ